MSDERSAVEALAQAADALYGVLPGAFVARRAELAKAARAQGDRALATGIAGLRKPTAAAWLVNAMVRQCPGELERLFALGTALRTAQAAGAGDELRALTRQRQQLVSALVGQAGKLAHDLSQPVGGAALAGVEETLRAAVADPDVADAVGSGCLTAAISYVGLGVIGPEQLAEVVALDRYRRNAPDEGSEGSEGSAGSIGSAVWAAERDRLLAAAELAEHGDGQARQALAAAVSALERARQACHEAEDRVRETGERARAAQQAREAAHAAVAQHRARGEQH